MRRNAPMTEIMSILEQDATLPPEKIAAMVGRPVEEVKEMIADLERRKVIRRYKAVVDWEKAGIERAAAFIDVRVQPQRGVGFDDVAERIYRFPEVRSVYLVSGDYDLRVIVEGDDIKQIAFFVADKLATIDRVQGTSTHFMLKKYKEDGEIFEEPEEDRRLAVTP